MTRARSIQADRFDYVIIGAGTAGCLLANRLSADDEPMAVVDSRLRVRGVAGLRVVDAGVMPTTTSGNTNSPTSMIAESAAAIIIQGA